LSSKSALASERLPAYIFDMDDDSSHLTCVQQVEGGGVASRSGSAMDGELLLLGGASIQRGGRGAFVVLNAFQVPCSSRSRNRNRNRTPPHVHVSTFFRIGLVVPADVQTNKI
jgi:hypothetical protein